jgi:Rieske Fe-S protein
MTRLRISALLVATLIVVAAKSISMDAQTTTQASPSATSKSATISLSIAVPNKQIPMGQKPWVHLTVTNLGSEEIAYPRDRVHVEGPNGEPPTTLVQRSITGRLNPGESEIPPTGFRPPIAAGASFTMKYDLSAFYDFKEPGKYTVYIEVFDRLSEKPNAKTETDNWVRSPVATFEVLAPTR